VDKILSHINFVLVFVTSSSKINFNIISRQIFFGFEIEPFPWGYPTKILYLFSVTSNELHVVKNLFLFLFNYLSTSPPLLLANLLCKGKHKIVPVLNEAPRHEDVFGGGDIAPRILDLGTRMMTVVSFTFRPFYLGAYWIGGWNLQCKHMLMNLCSRSLIFSWLRPGRLNRHGLQVRGYNHHVGH